MASRNGTANGNGAGTAAETRKRLTGRNYDERALASLGSERMISRAFIQRAIGDFDPENVPLFRLYQMRADIHIKMCLEFITAPLIRADWAIECEDPKIKAGLTEIVENVYIRWMKAALNMLTFGYQACVKSYELGRIDATYDDPATGEAKKVWDSPVQPAIIGPPIPLPPDNITVALDKGRFNGINTPLVNTENANDEPTIPPEFALWFTHGFEETFRNWYGQPRILTAYRPWWSFWFVWHMRDRHAEADADPALQVWYPPGTYPEDDGNGNVVRKQNRDAALQAGNLLRSGSTIAWPNEVMEDENGKQSTVKLWEAAFLQGGENLDSFDKLMLSLTTDKIRGCLVPEQALIEGQQGTGSRNAAATFVDVFTQSLEQISKYLDEIFTKYQLDPIREANWGADSAKAKKVTTGFRQGDMQLLSQLLLAAFTLDPNALPVDWENIMTILEVPQLSAKEQKEREDLASQEQPPGPMPGEDGAGANLPPPAPPGGPAGAAPGGGAPPFSGALDTRTPKDLVDQSRKDQVIHLTSKATDRKAPDWAYREGRRRDRNVKALEERLASVVEEQYDDIFLSVAEALADPGLELSIKDRLTSLINRVKGRVFRTAEAHRPRVEAELASIYHAAGLSELARMGLSGETWDVGRLEVQDYARERAGELITTMSNTVVERELRPFLEKALQDPKYQGTFIERGQGIPVDATGLAAAWREKHPSYPQWMAERVMRTEATTGYNLSAADMWERVGVQQVTLFDGLGGKTGETDEDCLQRNGETVTIEEFRDLVRKEHPNGTLGAYPVTANVDLLPLSPGLVAPQVAQSLSVYAVDESGRILSEEEVGRALAA